MSFQSVDAKPDFLAVEERVRERWRSRDVVRRALHAGGPDAPLLRFYDGPPTANGRPGVHHVEARVFKDVLPRYFAMKGYRVPRRAGWDCHGIPVELEVEPKRGHLGHAAYVRRGDHQRDPGHRAADAGRGADPVRLGLGEGAVLVALHNQTV